jgi:hypothetical protein
LEKLFERILGELPDYQAFHTVAEFDDSSRRLAAKYPELVTLEEVGKSRAGHPVLCLKIGSGSKRALLFGCPHPNEPIGSMMLEYLSWKLCEDAALRDALDFTWYMVKVADVDGTKLNEGWFKGPFTPRNYATHFFRPASDQQVEWTFPFTYKTYSFNEPIAETRALMKVIEEAKPDFMYSLHNAGFGGVYYYLSHEVPPELQESLRDLARQEQLPLKLGEPEMPYAVEFSPAVYKMPSTTDSYEYFARFDPDKDPAEFMTAGTCSMDYANQFHKTLTLVCEMPYFYDARIDNLTPTNVSRGNSVLESCDWDDVLNALLDRFMERVQPDLKLVTPFHLTVANFLDQSKKGTDAKRKWAASEGMARPATVAEHFDNVVMHRFYRVLLLGVINRMLAVEIAAQPYNDRLKAARQEMAETFDRYQDELEAAIPAYQVVPIRKLVAVQLGSALQVARYIQEQGV